MSYIPIYHNKYIVPFIYIYISYISYIMNEVKPLENVNKNLQRFLEISSIQTELAPLKILQDYVNE